MEEQKVISGPHQGQPVVTGGLPLHQAKVAMLMIHGRGASARDILTITSQLTTPGFTYLAPEAAGNAWYPNRFTAPVSDNEPWLSSALELVDSVFKEIVQAGIPPEKIILLGFSQGSCLVCEYILRNPRRYGSAAILSGGVIGPDDMVRNDLGSLEGTPIFVGCSDVDPFIPAARVRVTTEIFKGMGAEVTEKFYPNHNHSINQDEIDEVNKMMRLLI